MGVIAAMQAIHCTSDAPYVLLRLGPQRAEEGAYVWQKLMKSGRGGGQRNGRAGGGCQPAGLLLRQREPQAEGRDGVLSGPAHEPRGSA